MAGLNEYPGMIKVTWKHWEVNLPGFACIHLPHTCHAWGLILSQSVKDPWNACFGHIFEAEFYSPCTRAQVSSKFDKNTTD